jgi:hypothetical protein
MVDRARLAAPKRPFRARDQRITMAHLPVPMAVMKVIC